MPTKKFQRKIEDFICENCGHKTKGNGYTNHCPKCLYSLHVDINPGDREAVCHGLMKPISLVKKNKELKILQRCVRCGHERWNRVDKEDDVDVVISLSGK